MNRRRYIAVHRDIVITFYTTISKKLLSIPKLIPMVTTPSLRKKQDITKDPWPQKLSYIPTWMTTAIKHSDGSHLKRS